MSDTSIDRSLAQAESVLDRIDDDGRQPDGDTAGGGTVLDSGLDSSDTGGMHIEEGEQLEFVDGNDHEDEELVDAVDAFLEAFNARDLDAVVEVVAEDLEAPGLGNDIDNLPDALEDLWERRPTCLLTRGSLDGRCVGVVWELGNADGWWRIGLAYFDDVLDGRLGVVEFNDDPTVLELVETDPPDGDVEEGGRWEEWVDGAAPDA